LHLVHPLGFTPNDTKLKRAGLDYHDWENVIQHQNFAELVAAIDADRLFAFSTKGKKNYSDAVFQANDTLLFGPETRGLPPEILEQLPAERILRLPMMPNNRSLNLSNTVSIVAYEAWRQNGFAGGVV